LRSLAFPIIGAGSGGVPIDAAEAVMRQECAVSGTNVEVVLVRLPENRRGPDRSGHPPDAEGERASCGWET
jgi:hypothetical protein